MPRVIDTLASPKFAVSVMVAVAVACAAGSLLPQGTEVAAYVQHHPNAAKRIELLGQLGLTHVFSCWWFIALLCLLALSVATCSSQRFARVRRTTGFAQRRAMGSLLAHISLLLILAGSVVRGVWGEKGYVELREGQTLTQFVTKSGGKPLPFGLHLAKFEIETYGQAQPAIGLPAQGTEPARAETGDGQMVVTWPERHLVAKVPVKLGRARVLTIPGEPNTPESSFRIKFVKYVPDFYLDSKTHEVGTRSDQPRNPALLVEETGPGYKTERWLFAKFPDFAMDDEVGQGGKASPLRLVYEASGPAQTQPAALGTIKSFKSTLTVVENGKEAQTSTVEVNRPFSHKGYTFYQTGYKPEDLSWTSLQVVRDPGVPLVYAGFVLMIAGLFVVFYLNPWLARRDAAPLTEEAIPNASPVTELAEVQP